MTGLSPEAQAILDAGKSALTPSSATKADVLASVESAIAGGAASSTAGGFSTAKLLLVLAVAAGIGGGLWLYLGDGAKSSADKASDPIAQLEPATIVDDSDGDRPSDSDTPSDSDDSETPIIEAQDVPIIEAPEFNEHLLIEEPVIAPSTESRAKRKIKKEVSKAIGPINTLLAERKLLVAAKGAIGKGDYKGARATLGKHRREFPQGILSAERDALRAISLCLDPYQDTGPAEGKRFLKKHQQSPLAPRVKNICHLP